MSGLGSTILTSNTFRNFTYRIGIWKIYDDVKGFTKPIYNIWQNFHNPDKVLKEGVNWVLNFLDVWF